MRCLSFCLLIESSGYELSFLSNRKSFSTIHQNLSYLYQKSGGHFPLITFPPRPEQFFELNAYKNLDTDKGTARKNKEFITKEDNNYGKQDII